MRSEYHVEFAERLVRVRRYTGMNVVAFSRLLKFSRDKYYRLERGEASGINIDSLYRLEKIEKLIAETIFNG